MKNTQEEVTVFYIFIFEKKIDFIDWIFEKKFLSAID